jgi:hypothetical protein
MNNEVVRAELIRRQGSRSGREFARLLGISESYWSLVRRGERPITPALLERALKEFPDLLLTDEAEAAVAASVSVARSNDRSPGWALWGWKHFRLAVNLGLAALIFGAVGFAQFSSGDDNNGATAEAAPLQVGKHKTTATPTRTPRPLAHHPTPTKAPTRAPTKVPTKTPSVGCPTGTTPEPGNPSNCIPFPP